MCAICYVDPKTGRWGTNQTNHVCRKCRNERIHGVCVNVDWVEGEELLGGDADVAETAAQGDGVATVANSDLRAMIVDLFVRGLVIRVPFLDKRGRRRGLQPRVVDLTQADVAFLLDVNQQLVSDVLRDFVDEAAA